MPRLFPFFALMLSLPFAAFAEPLARYTARITSVHDGDTVRVPMSKAQNGAFALPTLTRPSLTKRTASPAAMRCGG